MKNLTKILIISFSLSLVFACEKKVVEDDYNKNVGQNDHETMGNSTNSASMSTVSFENKKISEIVNIYLILKDALVETDGAKAQTAARDLLATINEASDEVSENLKVEVQKVSETTDPESQRVAFDLISEQMVLMAKSSVLTEGKLFKQYCPMAKNNEGAFWLSASNEIKNPYFGDKMLNCGSVEEI